MSAGEARVVTARAVIDAAASEIFEQIADPSLQPASDGNDNLAHAPEGQRVRRVGDVFVMFTTKANERHNHVVELEEGRRIAWLPSAPGAEPPGHLWRWDVTPLESGGTEVVHTYDWTDLDDESRLPRARATTEASLRASIERLAALFA